MVLHSARSCSRTAQTAPLCEKFARKIGIEGVGPAAGTWVRQITMEEWAACPRHSGRRLEASTSVDAATFPLRRRTIIPTNQPDSGIPQGGTMASKASAVWTGSLKEGKGTISTATGVLNNANYSFATRFEGADERHHARGADCGGARELLLHGAGRAAGRRGLDARPRSRPRRRLRWPRWTAASRSPRSR